MSRPAIFAFPKHPERVMFGRRTEAGAALLAGAHSYRMGRDAMFHALTALRQQAPARETVLLPSYHCSSQVDVTLAAGLRCRFYPVRRNACIDMAALRTLMDDTVLAVVVVHYFGWPADMRALQPLAAKHDIAILEDCALALFSCWPDGSPLGRLGDAAIVSLRKTLPVLDGGLLRFNRPGLHAPAATRSTASLKPAVGALARASRLVPALRESVGRLRGRDNTIPEWRPSTRPAGPDFSPGQQQQAMSRLSRHVALRVTPESIVLRRRQRFQQLHDLLSSHPGYEPLLCDLPAGVCPLSLVLFHPQRDELERGLQRSGIETYCFGRFPHRSLPEEGFEETYALARNTVALPVHQELSEQQTEQLAKVVRRFL